MMVHDIIAIADVIEQPNATAQKTDRKSQEAVRSPPQRVGSEHMRPCL